MRARVFRGSVKTLLADWQNFVFEFLKVARNIVLLYIQGGRPCLYEREFETIEFRRSLVDFLKYS